MHPFKSQSSIHSSAVYVQKADAFLKNCFVEECTKGNSGTCKLSGHKFAKVHNLSAEGSLEDVRSLL